MARPRQTARKCVFQAPAMYHYESDNEVQRHPPHPPARRTVSTARKSAPWIGAQYHYSSDDEEPQQPAHPPRRAQPHPSSLQPPPIMNRKRSRDSEHHSEDDEPDTDLPLGKRGFQSLSDVDDELKGIKADNRALRAHIAELTAIERHRVALIEENNTLRAQIANLWEVNEENNGLRIQIDELHTFVRGAGVLLDAPPSIRRRIDARVNAAVAAAAPVRAPRPVVIDLT
ncbi:hypothetical protein LTR56_005537 [Elasticomyces elasticus]|nr:hypothetical protein LTR22_017923 [Elasticomyces elasticus]KAK3651729.1 hypothetical protein LTR56_005537 [Elasticomyces elasticus]KAK4912855.1 hypothetical protein LTR49_018711 [Elasticomyces elasticus]KAK5769172.1 hypothetical protein LTS12_000523 [Elasticomyces elasticus]